MEPESHDLKLGQIDIKNVTQRTVSNLGGKRTGKTTTLKMLAVKCPVPIFLFDPLDVIPVLPGFDKIKIGKKNVKSGKKFGQLLNTSKIKIDKGLIFSYGNLLQEENAEFTNDLFSTWLPKDSILAFDEIHEFCPETGMKMEYGSEVERAIRHWGNRNCGFIFTSQRPAFVSKKVLGLTDYLILFRMTWPSDIKVVKDMLKEMNTPKSDQIMQSVQTKEFLKGYIVDFRYNETKH